MHGRCLCISLSLLYTHSSICYQGQRMASVDGDADRLVYWYISNDSSSSSATPAFHLLDGDAIAVLAGKFIYEQLATLNLKDKIKVGVVQTAYANGAATDYLKSCGVPLAIAKTGIQRYKDIQLCSILNYMY